MKALFSFLVLVISTSLFSSEKPEHAIWDRYLSNYVSSSGTVNYKSMKVNMDSLDAYLLELRDHAPQTDWSSNEKLAYYINAYNAYTIKFVLSKYPVASVKDISFSGKDIWNFKMANLGGTNYTLNQIENDILRKMNEPRIHFAINCASKSCPKLSNQAYDADKMNSQLSSATKTFINDTKHNILAEKKLQLSALFEWYATDFNVDGKTLIDFLNLYSNITIQAGAKIEYLEYDWNLNE
ncbi:MAG: DUF547 domain-containing protein [Crocinitomicaceae bacterium]|nr:DUF547 domain-containing protein [Crocinitomicaceae bacterium]MBK8925098.1 DUF547 domain-containing protein [Crocinitomicaceae bacterium]